MDLVYTFTFGYIIDLVYTFTLGYFFIFDFIEDGVLAYIFTSDGGQLGFCTADQLRHQERASAAAELAS